jgi:hypothetical protein
MKMNTKILAVAVVAMFAMTAFVSFADDSDAANKTYHLYTEVIDADGNTVASGWESFECEQNNSAWAAAATVAFQKVMGKYVNDVRDYYITGNDDGVSVVYDASALWPATYYNKDGKWAWVEDTKTAYVGADSSAIIMWDPALYGTLFYADELPVGADAKNFIHVEQSWGSFWAKLPSTAPNGYGGGADYTLYIVAAVIIIIIVIAAVFFLKKKNA